MPSKQAKATSSSANAPARSAPKSEPAPRSQGSSETGERDESYALISVLYHVLQGAETIDQYIEDARRAEDDKLADFFEETKQEYVARAREAKLLLAGRLQEEGEDEDEDEDE